MQSANRPKYKHIDRKQMAWLDTTPDELIDEQHPARLIWELTSQLDLSEFESEVRSYEGEPGSPCWPPRLLMSVWLYAYQQGIASAREVERRMRWEPGLRWLCGLEVINVHTLCDFRMTQKEKLDELMAQLLTVLCDEGLVDLKTVVQDGTKIQARAGKGSAHRRGTLENKWSQAKAYMQQLDAEAHAEGESGRTRQQAARERAARERLQRLEAALKEMQAQQEKQGEKKEVRVSETEPEARRMRHTEHGGWMHSYNVQLSTETSHNFIVGVSVSNDQNDTQQLAPALQTVQRFTRRKPERLIADNGYVTRESIKQAAGAGVELIAPVKLDVNRQAHTRQRFGIAAQFDASRFTTEDDHLCCPAHRKLVLIAQKKHHGIMRQTYEAKADVCNACQYKPQCCPHSPERGHRVHRALEEAPIAEHAARMQTERAQQWYALRSRVAEFPHMRLKANWKLRRFSVRGMAKAAKEAVWMALAFNFSQWIWARRQQPAVA